MKKHNPWRRWPWPESWDKWMAWPLGVALIWAVLRGLWAWVAG